jgi:hypothetical protein
LSLYWKPFLNSQLIGSIAKIIFLHFDTIKENEARRQKGQSAKLSQFKKIKCLYCDRSFKTESSCTQHVRDVHPNAKTANEYHGIAKKAKKAYEYPEIFTCGYCGMKCISQKALEEHVISWKHL